MKFQTFLSILLFGVNAVAVTVFDVRGEGNSAYFERPTLSSLGLTTSTILESYKQYVRNTIDAYGAVGYLEVKPHFDEETRAITLRRNIFINLCLAYGLDKKDSPLSQEEAWKTYSRYYQSKTGKDLKLVAGRDRRDIVLALIQNDYRMFDEQMRKMSYSIRKTYGFLSDEERAIEARIPSIRAVTPQELPPKDVWEAKARYHQKLRDQGYSSFYIFLDGFLNPAWDGTFTLNDYTKIMGGFVRNSGANPVTVPSTH